MMPQPDTPESSLPGPLVNGGEAPAPLDLPPGLIRTDERGPSLGRHASGPQPPDPFLQGPSTRETVGAAWRVSDNPVASVLDWAFSMPPSKFDPNHNPRDTLVGTSQEHADFTQYANSPNEATTRALIAKADQRDTDLRTLSQSGWAGTVASVASDLLNPIYALPVLGELRGPAEFAAAGFGSATLADIAQRAHPWRESADNIASATILMGVLGAAHAHFLPGEAKRAAAALDAERPRVDAATGNIVAPDHLEGAGALGAAATDTRKLEPIGALGALKIPASPNVRVYTGESVVARRLAHDIAETAIKFEPGDQVSPLGVPLESQRKVLEHRLGAGADDIINDNWFEHYYPDGKPAVQGALGKEGIGAPTVGDRLSRKDFMTEVTKAMADDDVHVNPQVQAAAEQLRSKVYNPVKEMAQGAGLLGEEVAAPKGAKSYVPLVPNRDALIARRPAAKKTISDWLESEQVDKAAAQERLKPLVEERENLAGKIKETKPEDTSPEAIAKVAHINDQQRVLSDKIKAEAAAWRGDSAAKAGASDQQIEDSIKKILSSDQTLTRQELESRADEWIDRMINSPDGRLPYDAGGGAHGELGFGQQQDPKLRGSFHERKMAIPYQTLADLGIIHTDIEHLTNSMLHTMIPDILLTGRFGDIGMTNAFRELNEEFAAKIKPGMSEAEATKINDQRDAAIRDVAALRDRLRGTYGVNPNPGSRVYSQLAQGAQTLTMMSSLGGATISSLSDAAGAVIRYAFTTVARDVWAPMFQLMIDPALRKALKGQAGDAGIGFETQLGLAKNRLNDLNEHLPGNKFTRGLAWSADKFNVANMLGPWTDINKRLVWHVAQGEFGRAAERISRDAGTAEDLTRMADAGISVEMAKRISKQYEAHSVTVSGRKLATTEEWTDKSARDIFNAAMAREADIVVITPGIGDRPLWMSTETGRMIGQFKSFTAGAHEKLFIAGLQQRDARVLAGAVVMTGFGMMSYALSQITKGEAPSTNPADWFKEGLDRANLTAWFGEANKIMTKVSGGSLDYNRLYGAQGPTSRRAQLSPLAEVLGPVAGKFEGLGKAASDILSKKPSGESKVSADTIHKMRQAVILNNLFYFRRLADEAENGIAKALGIKPRQKSGAQYVQ